MKIKTVAYLFITISLICGALFPLALKVADNEGINIFTFMFLAYLIATPISFLFVVVRRKAGRLIEYLKRPKEFLFIGLLGFINLAFVDYGLIYTEKFVSASLATIVYRTQPLLMLVFLPIVLRERVSSIQVIALGLGILGVYIALTGGNAVLFSGADTGVLLLLVLITFVAGFATVFLKRYNTDMESTMFIFNSVALIIAFCLFLSNGAQMPEVNSDSIVALLYMGIVTLIAVPFFYYSAFRTLKTTFVTNYYLLSPFITVLFSGLLLQEPIYPYYLVIAVLVAVGILIQRFDKKGGTYVAKSKSTNVIFDVTSAFLNTNVDLIRSTMKGNGRVLAVKLSSETYYKVKEAAANKNRGLIIYTNLDKGLVSDEEDKFVTDLLGVAKDEVVLMSAGAPNSSEEFFDSISKIDGSSRLL